LPLEFLDLIYPQKLSFALQEHSKCHAKSSQYSIFIFYCFISTMYLHIGKLNKIYKIKIDHFVKHYLKNSMK